MCFCDHVELIVDDEDVWDVDEPFRTQVRSVDDRKKYWLR
jgi:hypothetical protein